MASTCERLVSASDPFALFVAALNEISMESPAAYESRTAVFKAVNDTIDSGGDDQATPIEHATRTGQVSAACRPIERTAQSEGEGPARWFPVSEQGCLGCEQIPLSRPTRTVHRRPARNRQFRYLVDADGHFKGLFERLEM